MSDSTKYVWVVTWFLHSVHPNVERYVLVAKMPGGGAKVRLYGNEKLIRPAAERTFCHSEQEMLAYVKAIADRQVPIRRRQADELEKFGNQPTVRVMLDEPPPRNIRLN